MKTKTIRTTAVLLLLATVLSILPVFGSRQTILVYSTESNSGQRDVICTTLEGTSAEDYYGNDYSYDRLSELPADYLYNALEELMTSTHQKLSSYADCRDLSVKTDCENNDGRVMLIYTSYSATRSDFNTGTSGWNREHVWPKSLGGFEESQAGSDLHHIRPSNQSVNSSRNNNLYGEVSGGSTTTCTMGGTTYIGGYRQGSTFFEPLDNVKGDVARICLYLYVRWADTYPKCGDITNVFQSVDVLLDWCEQDPVDTWEMGRNEVVGAIQGNRNVFIDYPEYAWLLFGREVPEDMITPSGEASDGNEGGTTSCTHKNTEIKNATSATCGKAGYSGDTYCKDCGKKIKSGSTIVATGNHSFGEWKTAADGSKSRTCSVCGKVETEGVVVPGTSVTISFADKANRTTYTTSQQVWKQNGITVTNDKAAATSNVGDYYNPGRFYKGSKVTIDAPGMTKIVIDCSGLETKYITPWSNSFTDSNATASVSGSTVTITFKTPVDSFTWSSMSAQGRANTMTVTTSADGGDIPVTPPETTPVTPPETTPVTPPETLAGQIAAANGLANKEYLPYESTITGTIIDDPQASSYTAGQYKFTVSDGTHTILCYFTPVTGGTPAKGDTVTVTGKLTAYNGSAQFDESAAAVLNKDGGDTPVTPPETTPVAPPETTPVTPPETLAGQIAAANGLANKEYLPYESTITGTIIDDPQASSYTAGQYKFTVSDGTHTILCYFTPVTGGTPAKGDTVTVTGKLTAYNGSAQFDESAAAVLNQDGGDTPVTPPETTPVTPPETTPVTPPETTPVAPPETTPVTPPETTPADCPHINVEYKNAVAPSCKEGYEGDLYCTDCGKFLEKGMVYPPSEAHQYGEATVSEDGKLETRICKVCGDELETAIINTQSDLTILWIVIGSGVAAGMVAIAVILIRKKRKV